MVIVSLLDPMLSCRISVTFCTTSSFPNISMQLFSFSNFFTTS